MRYFLFTAMLLPGLLQAESYTYNHVCKTTQGNDNFSIDTHGEVYAVGTIDLDETTITIDKKVYSLKPMKKSNCYRYKGGMFQLFYKDNKLVGVQQYDYVKFSNYRIAHAMRPLNEKIATK